MSCSVVIPALAFCCCFAACSTFPVKSLYLEDAVELAGYVCEERSEYALKVGVIKLCAGSFILSMSCVRRTRARRAKAARAPARPRFPCPRSVGARLVCVGQRSQFRAFCCVQNVKLGDAETFMLQTYDEEKKKQDEVDGAYADCVALPGLCRLHSLVCFRIRWPVQQANGAWALEFVAAWASLTTTPCRMLQIKTLSTMDTELINNDLIGT